MKTMLFFICLIAVEANGQVSPTVIHSQFALHPFLIDTTPENLSSIISSKGIIVKSTKPNAHGLGLDTIITIKSEKETFEFIKTVNSIFFNHAEISNASIKLNRGIQIGMSKAVFLKALNSEEHYYKNHTIIVTDSEAGYTSHYFYFENDKLVKISLSMNID